MYADAFVPRDGESAYAIANRRRVRNAARRLPSLHSFPEATLEGEQSAVLPHEVLLGVEIVSKSDPENHYRDKVHDYGAMGIPLHLIIDPRTGTGIVHSEPGYANREEFVFGDRIAVGPWTVDTGGLLTYA
ncbi:Uma2 family endonuclease [Kitasatospora sp. NPDC057692]|uniref:Uma2 family endonuclease n=1 Tax=Kitasatospora sp. NPDC057692 TaxID=3346215 RepID=UPI00367A4A02